MGRPLGSFEQHWTLIVDYTLILKASTDFISLLLFEFRSLKLTDTVTDKPANGSKSISEVIRERKQLLWTAHERKARLYVLHTTI